MSKKSGVEQMHDTMGATRGDLDQDGEIEVRDKIDLTHDERLRAGALAQACKYYTDTIVKDGALYTAMISTGKVLKPATYAGVLEVAFAFYAFLTKQLDDIAPIQQIRDGSIKPDDDSAEIAGNAKPEPSQS